MGPIRFQRQGTAPSIPTFGLNYGYEEGDDGVLKPQEVPVHDSTLGPAYYDLPQVSMFMIVIAYTASSSIMCITMF